jgi:DNA-binding response OmpR family regulator
MPFILVVDDEPAIADAELCALRSEGMDAEHRALGREVLRCTSASTPYGAGSVGITCCYE